MGQFDSWRCDEEDFLRFVTGYFISPESDDAPLELIVEDLPHGVVPTKITKHVVRMQGRILEKMYQYDCLDRVLFLPPATWERSFKGVWRKGPNGLKEVAEQASYQLPEEIDYTKYHKEERRICHKVASDYHSAYLMSVWAWSRYAEVGSFEHPTTSRYAKP